MEAIEIVLMIGLVVAQVGMAFCLLMIYRNSEVYKYRRVLLRRIREAAKLDIKKGREFHWRYDAFDVVEYDDMIMKFWKPLGSFYRDLSLTDPEAVDPDARRKHLETQSDMWPEKKS